MRRFCLYFSFLLAALVVAPNANAQDTLKLNQTYRDVIQLSFSAGKTQIPLPEGEWELLGLQGDQSDQGDTIWRVYLVRIENGTLVGLVTVHINLDLPEWGWAAADYCDRHFYFKEVKSNRESDVDCWVVNRILMKPYRGWREGKHQMYKTLLARNVSIPRRMNRAIFIRRSEYNFLRIAYYFHPSPPVVENTNLGDFTTRGAIKNWGERWKPKVDAGFLGELKDFKAKEALAPVKQSPKTSLWEEQRELSRSEVRSLLLGNTEVGLLKRPSRPSVEGDEGQAYKAFYRDHYTVWYKLDDSEEIKRWVWKVTEVGVLCRGPSFRQSWCRAITTDGAGGYKAVGFRTGNLRYQFRVEKGLFGLPEHLLK